MTKKATSAQRRGKITTYSTSPDEAAARYVLKKAEEDLAHFSIVPKEKSAVDSRTDTLDIKVPFGVNESGDVRMLKLRVIKALEKLQKNPLLKSKNLLDNMDDRLIFTPCLNLRKSLSLARRQVKPVG